MHQRPAVIEALAALFVVLASSANGQQQYIINTIAGGTLPAPAVQAATASIGSARSVTTDSAGNLYFISTNCVYKIDGQGALTRVAGSSRGFGYWGDGSRATDADLSLPSGLAVDARGNLFIADTGNNVIRKVTPDGVISTLAGDGKSGFLGDGGPAASAELSGPQSVAVDAASNVFIADSGNSRIRKVTPDGMIQTIAGGGANSVSYGYSGPAVGVALNYPTIVAVDWSGNIYTEAPWSPMILRIKPDGTISRFAGNGFQGEGGDGGPALQATLFPPSSVAADASGNVYITESYGEPVRRVAPDGTISRFAGGGNAAPGNGGPATSAALPADGVAADASGNVYASAMGSIYRIDPGGNIHLVAPSSIPDALPGENGPASLAMLSYPSTTIVDPNGNLYVGDGPRVRKISAAGLISTYAGGGRPCPGGSAGDGGAATAACLLSVQSLALDATGNLYVADAQDGRVRMVTPSGMISTYAGGGSSSAADGSPATSVLLAWPDGLASDTSGNLYISEESRCTVRKVSPLGIITAVAGTGSCGFSGDGGDAKSAQLYNPTGLAVDAQGNLFIADSGNQRVRKVDINGIITTVAGVGQNCSYTEGDVLATSACLGGISNVRVDASGNLFIAGTSRDEILEVLTNGMMTTLAGQYGFGYAGDGELARNAILSTPEGLSLDSSGNIYFADNGNGAVRTLVPQATRPVLQVTKVHEDVLAPGRQNVSHTLIVNNADEAGTSSGTVTVTDLLPTGMTLQDLSGPGWTCSISSASCSRSDPLAQSTAYPEITAVAGVAATAPLQYQDQALVGGGNSIFAAGSFDLTTIPPPVAITGIAPNIASPGGASFNLAVYGIGFAAGSTVQWNGTALSTTLAGSTQLSAAVPSSLLATPGTASITVVNSSGASSNAAPFTTLGGNILSVSPASTTATGPALTLTVQGMRLGAGSAVYWGSTPLATTFVSAAQLTALVPANLISAAGSVQISVRESGAATSLPITFTVLPAPVITGAVPGFLTAGSAAIYLAVQGTNLTSDMTVHWGSTALVSSLGYGSSGAYLNASVPASLLTNPGTFNLTIVMPGGIVSAPFAFPVYVAPVVTGLNPNATTVGSTPITLTVTGSNFVSGAKVSWTPSYQNSTLLNATFISTSKLTVTITPDMRLDAGFSYPWTPDSVSVTVVNPNGATSAPATFTLNPAPKITGLGPNWVTAGTGAFSLSVSGSAFTSASSVVFGTTALATTFKDSTQLTATVPANLITGSGPVNVTVITADGVTSSAIPFTIAPVAVVPQYLVKTVAQRLPIPPSSNPLTSAIGQPSNVATDTAGNVYFVSANCIYRIDAQGFLSRVAGSSGTPGYSGDGGPALKALLNTPTQIAIDTQGSIYIGDGLNHVVRRVAVDGTITTVVGNGTLGNTGDGGPATSAQLGSPHGVAVDSSGNLYISDIWYNLVRKVSPAGIISTFAGGGGSYAPPDGAPATSAYLYQPMGLATDAAGNLYIATYHGSAYKVTPAGAITTYQGVPPYNANLVVDAFGNLLVGSDAWANSAIARIAPDGTVSNFAGDGRFGSLGDGGPATSAEFQLAGLATDVAGNVYIADWAGGIRKIGVDGVIHTIAGTGARVTSSTGDGPLPLIGLNSPVAAAVDGAGNSYIADGNLVRKISAAGNISTYAGGGACPGPGDGGAATSACLLKVQALAMDAAGSLYIADGGDYRVRKVDPKGIISTVAGTGQQGTPVDGVQATSAPLNQPSGLALDTAGNLYISDYWMQGYIRKVSTSGVITTIAGGGTTQNDGVPATTAWLFGPKGLALDARGNLYIADSSSASSVRKVTPDGIISTVAGGYGSGAGDGGPATSAALGAASDVKVDAAGNVFIATSGDNRIRQILPNGIIETIAGNGTAGYSGDGGPATSAMFSAPQSLALDPAGNLYVVDSANYALRLLIPQGVGPALSLTKTHAEILGTGPSAVQYTLAVSNVALAGPTSGAITVNDILPAGLALQSISGSGWNCTPSQVSCTRTDSLAPGASYPLVNVSASYGSPSAPQVQNAAVVAGGGNPGPTVAADITNLPPAVAILGLWPNSAPAGSGALTISVYGSDFGSGSTVRWNNVALATAFISSSQLSAVVPAAQLANSGTASLTVLTSSAAASNVVPFGVIGGQIISLSPRTAAAGGPDLTLTVSGANLKPATKVVWGSTPLNTTFVSATQLTAVVPAALIAASGNVAVTLVLPKGGSSAPYNFSVTPAPIKVTSVTPSSVNAGGPDVTLTINGANFLRGMTINYSGYSLPVTYVSTTQVKVQVRAALTASPTTITLMLNNPDGGLNWWDAVFTVNPVLSIANLAPVYATAGGAAFTLTVNGSYFESGDTVLWGATKLSTTFAGFGSLTASVPAGLIATAGSVSVTVVSSAGTVSNTQAFTIYRPPAITSLNPTSATLGGPAFTLTVSGSGFLPGSQVLAASQTPATSPSALPTTYVSPTSLTVAVPAGFGYYSGNYNVTVANPISAFSSINSAPATFLFNPLPSISSLSPDSAIANGAGFTLTVNGTNFLPGTTVIWGNTALVTTFVSSTKLTATVTSSLVEAVGRASIAVLLPGGGTSFATPFRITQGPLLITSLSPGAVSAGSGPLTLTVVGSGFLPRASVIWGTTSLTTTYVSATQLSASVPASLLTSAGTVAVTVNLLEATSQTATFKINP